MSDAAHAAQALRKKRAQLPMLSSAGRRAHNSQHMCLRVSVCMCVCVCVHALLNASACVCAHVRSHDNVQRLMRMLLKASIMQACVH